MKKVLLALLFAIIGIKKLSAQADSIASFFQHEQSLLREKLYLHTDKPYYSAGDTIWFRGTLVNADTHSYLVQTNYIYVELLTSTDSLITRKKLKRDGLCFHNNIPLEVDLPEGDYHLRGYTEWMRNFDNCHFYSRKISVCNPVNKGVSPVIREFDYQVTFLPEGGSLLEGSSQRIAFIAQRSDGHSEEVNGVIYAEDGDTLAHFSTMHNGMGTVEMDIPVGKRLFAKTISQTKKEMRTFPLPDAESHALALQVCTQRDTLLEVRVLSSAGMVLPDGLMIVSHTRGIYNGMYPVKKGTTTISTSKWKDGISQLLLCTKEGMTLSRRLVFVHNGLHNDKWTLKTDRPTYKERERMQVDFVLLDEKGLPLRGDFSVSVTDASVIEPDAESDNIVSNLLLTSDLKGEIENPGWYFQHEAGRMEMLDLVMLTHGWSRFSTKNLSVKNNYSLPFAIEATQYISGHVEGIPQKEKNNLIGVYNPDDRHFATDVIRPDGTFSLEGLDFPDSTYFGIRLLSKKKYQRKIYVDKPTYPQSNYKASFVRNTQIPIAIRKRYMPDKMISIMLPDVDVKESKRSHFWISSNRFYASAWNIQELQTLYDPNTLVTALDFVNHLLKTTHAGLLFGYGCTNYLDGAEYEQGSVWGPLKECIVNTDVFSGYDAVYSALSRINLYDVDRIEIHNSLANIEPDGISQILIRFKPGGDYMQQAPDPRKRIVWPKGYALPEYFYHPAYGTSKEEQQMEDKRTTLYWNPSVQTDKKGKCSIVFFTSDTPNQYHIEIEGVTFNGRVCRKGMSIN